MGSSFEREANIIMATGLGREIHCEVFLCKADRHSFLYEMKLPRL